MFADNAAKIEMCIYVEIRQFTKLAYQGAYGAHMFALRVWVGIRANHSFQAYFQFFNLILYLLDNNEVVVLKNVYFLAIF